MDDEKCLAEDIGGNLGGPCTCSRCVRVFGSVTLTATSTPTYSNAPPEAYDDSAKRAARDLAAARALDAVEVALKYQRAVEGFGIVDSATLHNLEGALGLLRSCLNR